jgi:hypothetical protein
MPISVDKDLTIFPLLSFFSSLHCAFARKTSSSAASQVQRRRKEDVPQRKERVLAQRRKDVKKTLVIFILDLIRKSKGKTPSSLLLPLTPYSLPFDPVLPLAMCGVTPTLCSARGAELDVGSPI